MNATQNPVGQSAEFHQTWQALMQQLERVLSLAHQRQPNRTETREAVSIAKHLLGKVGDQLDAATQDLPRTGGSPWPPSLPTRKEHTP